jgi:UDP-GlcNAc:undecaprenyl-phosphate GlcNAc-1-phosphate transferase
MRDYTQLIFLPLLLSFAVTTCFTPLIITLVRRFGLLDDPKKHIHPGIIHDRPIPRGGGIALFLGVLVSAVFFLPWNPTTIAIFFSAFLALLVGVFDDKLNAQAKDVSPYLRFLVNILCAVIIVGSGISIPFITNPFGGILHLDHIGIPLFWGLHPLLLSDALAVFWIIWVMNMLNWSKGVDGQMPGVVAISAITIGVLSLRFTNLDLLSFIDAKLSFMIAGASLGFLLYNFPGHSRIFPGYGATSLYLLLAVVSILSSAKLATAIMVMGVPTVDAAFTIGRRLLARKSPFHGDKGHLHHMLLKIGLTQRQIALFYWAISAILGSISLFLQSQSKLFALIMLVVITGGSLLFLHRMLQKTDEKTSS